MCQQESEKWINSVLRIKSQGPDLQSNTSVKLYIQTVVKGRAECGPETQLKSHYYFPCFSSNIVTA